MNTRNTLLAAAIATSLLTLAACGGGGDSAVAPAATSTLALSITDSPVQGASTVWVQFTGVEVKPANGAAQVFTFPTPKGYDLLRLQNGNAAPLLGDTTVPAGEYTWIRLIADPAPGASYIIDSTGARRDIRIPSGTETGLKLIRGFTMPVGGRADFTIDFVLGKSIIAPPGQGPNLLMKPVLRLIDNLQWGTISGSFQTQTLANIPACAGKAPVVYLYPGSGVTPDDIFNPENGAADSNPAVDPLTTQTTALDAGSLYSYRIAFVPAGTYTVAFTCDVDSPTVDESAATPPTITFTTFAQPVVVTNGQTTTVGF
jgi:hypothetical protein